MMKGPDLTEAFLNQLRDQEVPIEHPEFRSGKIVFARIASQVCYLRHANLSHGRYYFGFATKDVDGGSPAEKAIIICGNGLVEHIFVMDFLYLCSVLREGKLVRKKRAVYEEYQATIYPERGYPMIVAGRHKDPIDVTRFSVPLAGIGEALTP